jgi:hypothetical protein
MRKIPFSKLLVGHPLLLSLTEAAHSLVPKPSEVVVVVAVSVFHHLLWSIRLLVVGCLMFAKAGRQPHRHHHHHGYYTFLFHHDRTT